MAPPKVLMVYEPTMGMHHDGIVLGDALRDICADVRIYSLEIPWNPNLDYESPVCLPSEIESLAPFDLVFLFEHLYGHSPLRSRAFARRRIFVPNTEWIFPQDEKELSSYGCDAILYKNPFSRDMCEPIACFSAVPVRCVTGWTSSDSRGAERGKNFRSFLHVKGLSDQKQTSMVLQAWLDNPEFPPLTILAAMHDNFRIPVPLKAAENVTIVFRKIPTVALREYQESCGVHVYPSFAEGFGHSLNETRVCESILITTDGPPMNDLVVHGETGFLVPVKKEDVTQLRRSMSYEIRASALSDTIREVVATPEWRLREIGRRSRESYLKDKSSFHARIRDVFGTAGAIPM